MSDDYFSNKTFVLFVYNKIYIADSSLHVGKMNDIFLLFMFYFFMKLSQQCGELFIFFEVTTIV